MKKWIIGCVLLLSACGQVGPFVDTRREAGQVQTVGQSKPGRPAICYNPIWSSEEKIKELADQECQKINRKAVYEDTKWFSCCFINPSTAFYTCEDSQ